MINIEHIDEYNQRYVTSSKQVTLGTEITTEIYTPYVYGQAINVRKLQDSIEVFGIITIITQVFGSNKELIAEGTVHESSWIEIWKKCWKKPKSNFKYTLDCSIIDPCENEIISGPSFISPDSLNNVIWGDVDPFGNVLTTGTTGTINLEFIDVWS